jgi:hypothetical protein
VITFLGVIIFTTIIVIGVFAGHNGPSMFATYRSTRMSGRSRKQAKTTEPRSDGK